MPPQIMTGATHLQTEKQHSAHARGGQPRSRLHVAQSCLHGNVQDLPYKEDVQESNDQSHKEASADKKETVCTYVHVHISSCIYTLTQLVCVCVCTHSHKQPIPGHS